MCKLFLAQYYGQTVVVKLPREDCKQPEHALKDLMTEIETLSKLRHKHIVRFLGSGTRILSPEQSVPFLILEYLEHGTLTDFLGTSTGLGEGWEMWRRKGRRQKFTFLDRLGCAYELAEALSYLHNEAMPGHLVLHRDLKPDNVAFTRDDCIKLFDFGLSKSIKKRRRTGLCASVYEMTGETGSLRYMAPEVARHQSYNGTADIYSWSLVVWEMIACTRPFEEIKGIKQFFKRVVHGGERPPIDADWPPDFQELLKKCWSLDLHERPSAKELTAILKMMLQNEMNNVSLKEQAHRKNSTRPIAIQQSSSAKSAFFNPGINRAERSASAESVSSSPQKNMQPHFFDLKKQAFALFGASEAAPIVDLPSPELMGSGSMFEVSDNDLTILVLSGTGLPVMDFFTSDPYLKIKVGDVEAKSRFKPNTLNPVWNEVFCIHLPDSFEKSSDLIKFEAWDYDFIPPHDFMGLAEVKWSEIKGEEIELPLRSGKDPDHLNGSSRGAIRLQLGKGTVGGFSLGLDGKCMTDAFREQVSKDMQVAAAACPKEVPMPNKARFSIFGSQDESETREAENTRGFLSGFGFTKSSSSGTNDQEINNTTTQNPEPPAKVDKESPKPPRAENGLFAFFTGHGEVQRVNESQASGVKKTNPSDR